MPWIDEDKCNGCNVCIDECPADAIALVVDTAKINDDECIRCGECHDVCSEDAVWHDSERMPMEIEKNIAWVKNLMGHSYYDDIEEKKGLVDRLYRYFGRQIKVAEQTMIRINLLKAKL